MQLTNTYPSYIMRIRHIQSPRTSLDDDNDNYNDDDANTRHNPYRGENLTKTCPFHIILWRRVLTYDQVRRGILWYSIIDCFYKQYELPNIILYKAQGFPGAKASQRWRRYHHEPPLRPRQ